MRVILWLSVCCVPSVVNAAVTLQVDLPRTTYWRGEAVRVSVSCKNNSAETIPASRLQIHCGEWVSTTVGVPPIARRGTATVPATFSTQAIRSGVEYPLTFQLFAVADDDKDGSKQPIAEAKSSLFVVRPPNPQRLNVWQWSYGGPSEIVNSEYKVKARDVGFTVAGGPVFPYSPPDADPEQSLKIYRPSLGAAMKRGMDISICPVGVWHREFNLMQPRGVMPLVKAHPATNGKAASSSHPTVDPRDDTRYQGAGRNGQEYFNPFHPEVARQQNHANELMMRQLGDYPNLKYAFVDAEWVDDLYYHNANAGGLALLKQSLGFTREEIGSPKFVRQGVVADDDRGVKYRRYVFQRGNGINLALRRAADAVHRHRPDVKLISDPYRSAALLDMFPGCDIISTWTYTNPDPKLMLYIETLRAVCKPAGQEPMHVVTLLNYPGSVVPEAHDKNWMMMGRGRLLETTWINLSRAPKIVGYYAFDGYYKSKLSFSLPAMATLTELSQRVFAPYGPMLRQLDVAPRRIALLSSDSSRLYGQSPGLLGYPNYQAYHFYTVLAMAHLNADVVFDETIERYGLDDYDVLVLPKCDVLTEAVYKQVLKFQQRGGIVVADQFLGPELTDVARFDFDFTHRRKVTANAIATGKIYKGEGEDDHIVPGKSEMQKVTGVTARQDQLVLESYAARLRKELAGKIEPDVWCDQHDVLVNVLESQGVKYLVLINDKRTYDDRTGPFKAVMEQLVPQTVTVRLRREQFPDVSVPYDLLAHQAIQVTESDGVVSFQVKLTDIGGTFVVLAARAIGGIKLDVSRVVRRNTSYRMRVRIVQANNQTARGVHPLRIRILGSTGNETEYSHYACALGGRYEFDFLPALNDPVGQWKIHVDDLSAGMSAMRDVNVVSD